MVKKSIYSSWIWSKHNIMCSSPKQEVKCSVHGNSRVFCTKFLCDCGVNDSSSHNDRTHFGHQTSKSLVAGFGMSEISAMRIEGFPTAAVWLCAVPTSMGMYRTCLISNLKMPEMPLTTAKTCSTLQRIEALACSAATAFPPVHPWRTTCSSVYPCPYYITKVKALMSFVWVCAVLP